MYVVCSFITILIVCTHCTALINLLNAGQYLCSSSGERGRKCTHNRIKDIPLAHASRENRKMKMKRERKRSGGGGDWGSEGQTEVPHTSLLSLTFFSGRQTACYRLGPQIWALKTHHFVKIDSPGECKSSVCACREETGFGISSFTGKFSR